MGFKVERVVLEMKYETYQCKYCKSTMRLDDMDIRFRGNQDNYYYCDCCGASAVVEIRYGKFRAVTWQFGD